MALQHLRSSTANKRPTPAAMSDGQLAVNTAGASPGLFFKDSSGNLIKVGPVHVGTTAPNASPAAGGETGNTVGEQWLDTSSSRYVFKVWDGTAWRSEAGEFVDVSGDVMTGALGIIAGTAGAPGLYVSGDTNTGVFSAGADQLAITTGGTARLTVDSTGKILAGTSTALTNAYAIGSALSPALQVEGNTANGAAVSITRHTSAAANLLLQRGVSGTPVADADPVGQIGFNGYDGANYFNAALIRAVVDGTPGTGSMPGRLSLQTTPSGSTTPVERIRVDSSGNVNIDSGTFYVDATNNRVGVGTTSPNSRLETNELSNGAESFPLYVSNTGSGVNTRASIRFNVASAYYGSIGGGAEADGSSSVIIDAASSTGITKFTRNNKATETARFDGSGRLLVGTSTARDKFFNTTYTPQLQLEGVGQQQSFFSLTNSVADNGGSVLGLAKQRSGSVGGNTIVNNGDTVGQLVYFGSDGTEMVSLAEIVGQVDGPPGANDMPGRLVFSTTADGASSPTERMRIGNDGRTSTFCSSTTNNLALAHAAGAGTTYKLIEGAYGATGVNTGTESFRVYTNGNVQNTNNSYGAISDIKLKENIVDASSQWDDIKAIQVRNYNFKEGQTHTQIGLVAQEVELVSPGLVSESPDRDAEGNDLGTVTKSVNYSVLYMKAVKALQEAMERIETLEAKVAALEAA